MRVLLEEWQKLWVPEYRPRTVDYGLVFGGTVPKVTVFSGCRRAGKTYLMFQLIDHLHRELGVAREQIVYLNFEDERVEWETATLTELLPLLFEHYGELPFHLFLDEIHHIPRWDRWVRRVHDQYPNLRIYLASSSSKLSINEIPYALRGRTMLFEVFPLSFIEFASLNKVKITERNHLTTTGRAKINRLLTEYLDYGGFPEIVFQKAIRKKHSHLNEYYRTILALDVIERYGVKNQDLLHDFVKLLLGQTTFSVTKTYNTIKSKRKTVGKETLLNFTRYLEEVYLAFFVPILSAKVKDQLYYPRKVYFIDNGFISHLTLKFTEDRGRKMENVVFLDLLKRWGRQSIRYWKGGNGYEVDFAIVEGSEVPLLVQVCADPGDPDTRRRELRGLAAATRELEADRLVMVTWEVEGAEELPGGQKVELVPLYRWLQEQEAERRAVP